MSDIELGSVISLIMENPELVAEIKRLAESKAAENTPTATEEVTEIAEKPPEIPASATEVIRSQHERRPNSKGKRSELLHALAPYISEGRQKALETFMTIADILDMMREK